MIIVAGISRSGLSLTMQMLYHGGMPCIGDPPAFEPYPMGTIPWNDCEGKAIKLVDAQLQFPPHGDYSVIRLARSLDQQARSIMKFARLYVPGDASEEAVQRISASLIRDYKTIDKWAVRHRCLFINFETLIKSPREAAITLRDFVGHDLHVGKMVDAVFERSTECLHGMLEVQLIDKYRGEQK